MLLTGLTFVASVAISAWARSAPRALFPRRFFDKVLQHDLLLMIWDVLAIEIGLFPAAPVRFGVWILHSLIVRIARFLPTHIGIHQFDVCGDVAYHRSEPLKVTPALGHDHCDRLALLESDQVIGPRHLPIHGESGFRPVGL